MFLEKDSKHLQPLNLSFQEEVQNSNPKFHTYIVTMCLLQTVFGKFSAIPSFEHYFCCSHKCICSHGVSNHGIEFDYIPYLMTREALQCGDES